MRLNTLSIQNYRSCYETTVEFSKHVTLLVGENDAGKSNIIDALRGAIPPASGRLSKWFDAESDLSFGVALGEQIQVKRTYSDLTDAEDSFYTPALVDRHRNLVHTTRFLTDPVLARRNRLLNSIGDKMIPDPEPENRDRIVHVYLPPLRDAAAALDSAGSRRLAEVFRVIASQDEIEEFEREANETLRDLAMHQASRKVVKGVQDHLSSVTRPVRHRLVDLKHRDQRIASLTRALRLHMAAEGFSPSDLIGSGLGYANLLFIATVVLELEKAKEFDLMLLLVEEPEAHLHPQLQSVLLSYLEEQAVISAEKHGDPDRPEGRIQVIATSHSPHLSSSLSTSEIVVVRLRNRHPEGGNGDPQVEVDDATEPVSLSEVAVPIRSETITVPLASVDIPEDQRRKVDRYLDATRSALLFARQVVLVEGIAEALLMRTLAERIIFSSHLDSTDDVNQESREQFRAISIVPIGGVDFMPFLELLLGSGTALVDRLVVVTDGDGGYGDRRKQAIAERFQPYMDAGCLVVEVGATTLEAELFGEPENETLLRDAFSQQHPLSLSKWDELCPGVLDPVERADKFSLALKEGRLDLGKGDFAHVISELLEDDEHRSGFAVPGYLRRAIRSAIVPRRNSSDRAEQSP